MKNIKYSVKDRTTIKDMMNDVRNGKYIIPVYQREYVWSGDKVIDLLESVINKYPIGMITDSLTSDKSLLSNGRNDVLDILSLKSHNFDKAIVDGQQRVTSLAIVYFADVISENMNKINNINVEKSIKKVLNNTVFHEGEISSLKKLKEDLKEKLSAMDIDVNEEAEKFLITNPEVNEKLRDEINDYILPILRLENGSDNEVINVFTAMNKGGKPLTHIELMNGAMFNIVQEFDLINYIKSVNSSRKDFGEISPELFVQLMKIFHDIIELKEKVNFSKKELVEFSMTKQDVKKFCLKLSNFEDILDKSIGLLKKELGIYNIGLIPKNVYLIIAFAYSALNSIKTIDIEIFRNAISRITRRLLEGVYASSPGARAMEDVNNYLMPASEGNVIEEDFDSEEIKEILSKSIGELVYKNKSQALFKIFISILCRRQPRFILKDDSVSVIASTGIDVKNDMHHFIPLKSSLSSEYGLHNDKADFNVDSIRNISVITSDENRKEIRNDDIDLYLLKSKDILGEQGFEKMLESHYFDPDIISEILTWRENGENPQELKDILERLFRDREEVVIEEIMKVYFNQRNK